jgi:hypothetical protein
MNAKSAFVQSGGGGAPSLSQTGFPSLFGP